LVYPERFGFRNEMVDGLRPIYPELKGVLGLHPSLFDWGEIPGYFSKKSKTKRHTASWK